MRACAAALVLAGCSAAVPVGPPRDWEAHPAFRVEATVAARVWAISDVHGGAERLAALLQGAGLTDAQGRWAGGADRLYVLGDCIDKSPGGLAVLTSVKTLAEQAGTAGGEVVLTLGNHEAEFLADPTNSKADAFVSDLRGAGLSPSAVASGSDIGGYLRDLPFGVLDGDWFFSHAGNTNGRALAQLADDLRADVEAHQFAAKSLIGSSSLLEAERWWEKSSDSAGLIDMNLGPLGAKHLVFGHDPSAFGRPGALGQKFSGRIFMIDVGMSPAVNNSTGVALLVERGAGGTHVSAVFPSGERAEIYAE